MSNGYCALRLTRRYAAAQPDVWAVLTEPASLSRWLAPVGELDLSAGGALELGGVRARVRALEPGRMLELDWRYPGEEPSIVRFELEPDGEGTRLVLDHRQVQEPVGMRYISRWTVALGRLGREPGVSP